MIENNQCIILLILLSSIIGLWMILKVIPIPLWFKALTSGVRITFLELLMMWFRKVPAEVIINCLIKSAKGGVSISRDELEAIHLAGGNIKNITNGLVYAKINDIELSIKDAIKLDSNKKDIVKEISK